MIKLYLILGLIGHLLCGVSDCLLSYSKKGRLNFKDIGNQESMEKMFRDMPASFPLASILLGTFAIILFGFGYFGLGKWMRIFFQPSAAVMNVCAIVFLVSIVTHHVFCGVVEWMYIRLGRTADARDAVLEFQKKTMATMYVGYAALAVIMTVLFVMIVTGKTGLPRWSCVFNSIVMMLVLLPTRFPAKGNIAGAVTFLGFLILL